MRVRGKSGRAVTAVGRILVGTVAVAMAFSVVPASEVSEELRQAEFRRIDAQMEQLWQEHLCIERAATLHAVDECRKKYGIGKTTGSGVRKQIGYPGRTMMAKRSGQ